MESVFRKIKRSIGYRVDKNYWRKEKINDGYKIFLETGETSLESFHALIDMYCKTNGKYNEDLNEKLKKSNPPAKAGGQLEGVVGSYSSSDFVKANNTLNENGYLRFDKKLNKDVCEKIYNLAFKIPATIPPAYDKKVIYNPDKPLSEIYRFDMQDLINNEDIQKLITDPVLVNIARNYLGCEPILDFPAMWWSTAFQKEASAEAAQLYHFDLDRIKWLKIFFYINEVDAYNGPHCYIQGTQKPGAKPDELLKRGYARIPDSDLKKYYKEEDFIELRGEAGAIFAGDTKCWHKGKPLEKGHRLVLEFEYASSLFGAAYPKMIVRNYSNDFKEFCNQNHTFSSQIIFK